MNIYVGNLSFDATQNDIHDAFSQYGDVSSVNVIMDRETGRPRGFAFVEMPNDEEARAAVDGLNLQEIAGRAVNVNEAKPREDRSGGGRGRWSVRQQSDREMDSNYDKLLCRLSGKARRTTNLQRI